MIRYEIEPARREAFERDARAWNAATLRCGAEPVGTDAPHEGSAAIAYGVYDIADLAAYEAFRARPKADRLGQENLAFARSQNFIRRVAGGPA